MPSYPILYYPILYYTILFYTVLYYTVLYYTILYYTILSYTVLCYTILYYTILYYPILYCTVLYYTILSYPLLYYTVLYYAILYYTTIYYTILYYTILYILSRILVYDSRFLQDWRKIDHLKVTGLFGPILRCPPIATGQKIVSRLQLQPNPDPLLLVPGLMSHQRVPITWKIRARTTTKWGTPQF